MDVLIPEHRLMFSSLCVLRAQLGARGEYMECPPGVLDQRLLRNNETVLLEGTSWKHQAHEAVGECFQRKVIVFVRKASLVKDLPRIAHRLVAP